MKETILFRGFQIAFLEQGEDKSASNEVLQSLGGEAFTAQPVNMIEQFENGLKKFFGEEYWKIEREHTTREDGLVTYYVSTGIKPRKAALNRLEAYATWYNFVFWYGCMKTDARFYLI